jgi:hypothetical protein
MFLRFWIEYREDLCGTVDKHSWITLVTYIFQVNQCELVVVYIHTIRVFYPLTPEDGYSYSQAVIEFPYVLYVPIIHGFQSLWINSLDAYHDATQLDGQEASIFIVISSVGISLSINHVVKTRQCSFMIHASMRPMLSL